MTDTTHAPGGKRFRDLLDVILFLVVVIGVGIGERYVVDPQSEMGGVIGIFTTMATAWILIAVRGQRWRDLGLRWPKPLWALPLWTIAIVAVTIGLTNIIAPLVTEPPDVTRFAALKGDILKFLMMTAAVWVTAALFEELIFRGFLLSRLASVVGMGVPGLGIATLLQAGLFGLLHIYQGWGGVLLTGIVGFIFGLFYFLNGRNLWALILAHGIIDTLSLTQIFFLGVPGAE